MSQYFLIQFLKRYKANYTVTDDTKVLLMRSEHLDWVIAERLRARLYLNLIFCCL